MLYLVLLTFGVFLLFWLGDFYVTFETINKSDNNVELNPILRKIFSYRKRFVYLFKTIEILVFSYLVYFITVLGGNSAFKILLIFILIYGLFVINNVHIYYKITKKESLAFKFIFLILLLFLILFIYLNYLLYSDLNITYQAISECNSNYINFYNKCNSTNDKALKPENRLNESNFPIKVYNYYSE